MSFTKVFVGCKQQVMVAHIIIKSTTQVMYIKQAILRIMFKLQLEVTLQALLLVKL